MAICINNYDSLSLKRSKICPVTKFIRFVIVLVDGAPFFPLLFHCNSENRRTSSSCNASVSSYGVVNSMSKLVLKLDSSSSDLVSATFWNAAIPRLPPRPKSDGNFLTSSQAWSLIDCNVPSLSSSE